MIITERDMAVARQCIDEVNRRRHPGRSMWRSDSTVITLADGTQHTYTTLARCAPFKADPTSIKRKMAAGMTADEAIRFKTISDWKHSKAKAKASA